MPSKLSIHISFYPDRFFDIVERMQPSVAKVFNYPSEMNIDEIRIRSPRTIVVYRQYTNLDYHNSTADAFFAEITDTFNKLRGRGVLWEGINEPVVNSVEDAQALSAWTVRFAQLMHAQGELVAGFSWSTGNPVNIAQVVPYLTQAAAAVDVHAFHEYYSTWGGAKDWGRYREFESALPANARKPVVLTEAGLDDNGDQYTGGYRGKKSYREYLEILKAYDQYLLQDPYVLGATVFQWGDWSWPSFELSPMIELLANYVASVGGGAVIPKPWPIPAFGPPPPTYSFSAVPDTITVGQSATLAWNVLGANEIYLDGASVAAQEMRVVTPEQTTTYTLHLVLPDGTTQDLTATVTVEAQVPPTPTYSFTITPEEIAPGQTALLTWDVEGVREVYVDGEGVTGHGSRAVSPESTTTYTLLIVLRDGSTDTLTATLTVATPPIEGVEWDARLDDLGVTLERSSAPSAWRVVSAAYQDAAESGDKHHVFFKVLRPNGEPMPGFKFVIDWLNRDPSDEPAVVTTDSNGEANCPLWAAMHPDLKDGIYFVLPKTEPGDTVRGLGLPSGKHISFVLTYQYASE